MDIGQVGIYIKNEYCGIYYINIYVFASFHNATSCGIQSIATVFFFGGGGYIVIIFDSIIYRRENNAKI